LVAVLVPCLLLLWISEFCSYPVAAELSSHVGVKIGDMVKYGNFRSFWASESPSAVPPQILYNVNNTLSVVNTVVDVSNITVSFESRTTYRNGTEQVEEKSIDVIYGISLGNLPLVAADLAAGDRVSLATEFPPYRINSTSLREYCGVMRQTNLLNVTQVYTITAYRTKLYWDKATGLLTEYSVHYSELDEKNALSLSLISYSMVDNNVWIGVPDSMVPVAEAGSDRIVDTGETVVFDAGGSADNVGITKVLWDFGDGESAMGLSVSHIYDSAGVFNVTLTVEDGAGNKDTDHVTVTVQEQANPIWTYGFIFLIVALVVLTSCLLVWRFSKKRHPRRQSRTHRLVLVAREQKITKDKEKRVMSTVLHVGLASQLAHSS
jgi:PKD repeat protein